MAKDPKYRDSSAEFQGLTIIHQKIPGREVGTHTHAEHEFFVPLQGEISITIEAKVTAAGPGRMLYVPPGVEHAFRSASHGSGERVICLIQKPLWQKQVRVKSPAAAFSVNRLAKELIFYLLIHKKNPGSKYFIQALIETLGESLSAEKLRARKIESEFLAARALDSRVQKAIELMSGEESLSLNEIARGSGLSTRNLSRLFKDELGLGPKDFMILRRMEHAQTLLRESKLTVTDIALEVGYQSLSKFIETFKKFSGCLPSDFREMIETVSN